MVVGVVGIVMPVEFLGIGATNDGTETHARSGPAFDPEYTVALARAHEESGWDRVLTAYGSGSPDPAQAAALIACRTERLQLLLAHRPNVAYPTFTAKTVATLDQISGGRLTLHVITGGNDHEQQREGDTLPKDRRYDRTREAIQIFKRAWTERSPFDFHGEHYSFDDFVLDVEPEQKPRPKISFGGSSAAAYKVGAEEADIYALWGEPLAGTAEQIATITQLAKEAGRPAPTFQVAFRPILVIPHFILLWFLGIAWGVTTLIAWVSILITGNYPSALYQFAVGVLRWSTRVEAYVLLLRDEYPPFSLE